MLQHQAYVELIMLHSIASYHSPDLEPFQIYGALAPVV